MNPVLLSLATPAKLSGQRQRGSAQQYEFKFQNSSTVRAHVAPMIPGLAQVDFLLQELLAKHDPPPVEVAGLLRCESLERMSQISNSCDLQICVTG